MTKRAMDEALEALREIAAEAEMHARIVREKVQEAERLVRELAGEPTGLPSSPS